MLSPDTLKDVQIRQNWKWKLNLECPSFPFSTHSPPCSRTATPRLYPSPKPPYLIKLLHKGFTIHSSLFFPGSIFLLGPVKWYFHSVSQGQVPLLWVSWNGCPKSQVSWFLNCPDIYLTRLAAQLERQSEPQRLSRAMVLLPMEWVEYIHIRKSAIHVMYAIDTDQNTCVT